MNFLINKKGFNKRIRSYFRHKYGVDLIILSKNERTIRFRYGRGIHFSELDIEDNRYGIYELIKDSLEYPITELLLLDCYKIKELINEIEVSYNETYGFPPTSVVIYDHKNSKYRIINIEEFECIYKNTNDYYIDDYINRDLKEFLNDSFELNENATDSLYACIPKRYTYINARMDFDINIEDLSLDTNYLKDFIE